MASGPVISLLTLGCKLNIADSEEMARAFAAAGCTVVDRPCQADAFVVNSCSVTHVADRKSRHLLRAARRLSPGAVIALTGCYAEAGDAAVIREAGADFALGTRSGDKRRVVDTILQRLSVDGAEPPPIPASRLRTRAFVKVQEGCNDVCAFCIVPQTRGRERSTPAEAVAREVQARVEEGAQEVVLTGTQLGAYGRDGGEGLTPAHLIRTVLEHTTVPRLRFSSLQPQDITPEFLWLWTDPRLCRHFHLALQSGCEATLRRMRRRYTIAQYREATDRIRASIPGVAITTDVIAGFPEEDGAEFEESLRFCREAGFAGIHAFPYSPRRQTAAARMPGQVAPEVKKERVAALIEAGRAGAEAFARGFDGRVLDVLFEEAGEPASAGHAVWSGFTDNYIRVSAPGRDLGNRILPTALRFAGGAMQGTPLVTSSTATQPGGDSP